MDSKKTMPPITHTPIPIGLNSDGDRTFVRVQKPSPTKEIEKIPTRAEIKAHKELESQARDICLELHSQGKRAERQLNKAFDIAKLIAIRFEDDYWAIAESPQHTPIETIEIGKRREAVRKLKMFREDADKLAKLVGIESLRCVEQAKKLNKLRELQLKMMVLM